MSLAYDELRRILLAKIDMLGREYNFDVNLDIDDIPSDNLAAIQAFGRYCELIWILEQI